MKTVIVPYMDKKVFREVSFLERIKSPIHAFPDGKEINEDVIAWLETTVVGKWYNYPTNRQHGDPLRGRAFEFHDDDNAAMLFKLTWGGA